MISRSLQDMRPSAFLKQAAALLLLIGVMVSVSAQEQSVTAKNMEPVKYKDTGRSFFDESDRGWHWYEDPLKDEMLEKPVETPVAPKPPEKKAETKPEKPPGPAPMSTEWLHDNLPKYLGKAMDNPSDDNVRAYLYLQKLAIDKAELYANASGRVTANDPYLDGNVRRPISNFGSQAADEQGIKVRTAILNKLRKNTGVLFFFRGNCEYCHIQWPVLQRFSEKYKFPIVPVSMDGGILDGMDPKSVRLDRGQSDMLNVTVVPTMILLQPPNKFGVVSYGLSATEEFPDLIASAAVTAGLITETDYAASQGYKETVIRGQIGDVVTEEIVADPKKLVDYMKSKIKLK